jgi:hypothetical protein
VSFGKEAVFPFPAVQYIPLKVTEICQNTIQPSNKALSVQLIIGENLEKWRLVLWQDYQFTLDKKFSKDTLPILAMNVEISSARYRGYFVTMLGKPKNSYYQLFTLPQQYFYKRQLCFELFDENTCNLLTRTSYLCPV